MAVDDILAAYLESGVVDDDAVAALVPGDRAQVRDALAALDRARAGLRAGDAWAEPAPDLEARVLAAVFEAPADPATTTTAAPARAPATVTASTAIGGTDSSSDSGSSSDSHAASSAPVATVASLADARVRRSRLVAIGASLVAAAAIVVAIVGFTTRPAAAPNGPTGTEFALASTDLLKGASGKVHVEETNSGVRIYLDATGLPRRDNGQFYEAWAKTSHGLVALGTFHTGTDVVLWSGVSLSEIDAITVTLEDNDGNQESSGQRVLIAQLR